MWLLESWSWFETRTGLPFNGDGLNPVFATRFLDIPYRAPYRCNSRFGCRQNWDEYRVGLSVFFPAMMLPTFGLSG
jgi:hypothetical protein